MNRKPIITSIKTYYLTFSEKMLFKKEKPWGIILFSRNISNLSQLEFLIKDIKKTINDKNYPILIDQEGGKVSRLNKIIDLSLFSQNFFGDLYKKKGNSSFSYYKIVIHTFLNEYHLWFLLGCLSFLLFCLIAFVVFICQFSQKFRFYILTGSFSFFIVFCMTINFLLSDYSEAITGEIIHVDGGAHAIGGSMLGN